MADFVAVLKKTIDGLGDTTPEMRLRVYDKARSTVAAKLAAINPPPPPSVAERQKRSLEDAIAEVERQYVPDGSEPDDPLASLSDIFPSLGSGASKRPGYAAAAVPARSWDNAAVAPAAPTRSWGSPSADPYAPPPAASAETDGDFDTTASSGPVFAGEAMEETEGDDAQLEMPRPERRRNYTGLIAAAVAVLVLAGGGYAVWLNRAAFQEMLGIGTTEVASAPEAVDEPTETPAAPGPGTAQQTSGEPAAIKFTQRLQADGSEIDEGPAGGVATVGEGTSVAAVTSPPTAPEPPAADATTAPTPGGTGTTEGTTAPTPDGTAVTPPADPGQPAATGDPANVAVQQRAIYYEERTNVAQGSADTGSIVWSLVQESPGGDLPPEPAIRAEATIPAKNLQLTMTIRRNGDRTLPFSHMIELIFLTPDNFEGGGIDNILRFALKETEEAAGNSVIGTPAKIGPGFFLVALNDAPAEVEANLTMLRGLQWIDIPLIYKSGRRALITLEKGVPGDQVFDQVLKSWQAGTAG
jgi:hypothetical protein